MNCTKCGTPLAAGATTCPVCGMSITQPFPAYGTQPAAYSYAGQPPAYTYSAQAYAPAYTQPAQAPAYAAYPGYSSPAYPSSYAAPVQGYTYPGYTTGYSTGAGYAAQPCATSPAYAYPGYSYPGTAYPGYTAPPTAPAAPAQAYAPAAPAAPAAPSTPPSLQAGILPGAPNCIQPGGTPEHMLLRTETEYRYAPDAIFHGVAALTNYRFAYYKYIQQSPPAGTAGETESEFMFDLPLAQIDYLEEQTQAEKLHILFVMKDGRRIPLWFAAHSEWLTALHAAMLPFAGACTAATPAADALSVQEQEIETMQQDAGEAL